MSDRKKKKKEIPPLENGPEKEEFDTIVVEMDDARRDKFATLAALILNLLVEACDGPGEAAAVLQFTFDGLCKHNGVRRLEMLRYPTDKLQ